MDLKNTLIELGFSKNEATVYLALLELGMTQAGPVVKKTKLHRMMVYNALEKFVDEGFATVARKKNIQLFQATDPTTVYDSMKKKEALARTMLPALRDLQRKEQAEVTVRTLIGREGFITNLQEILESVAKQKDRTMRIIGGGRGVDFYEALGEWYGEYMVMCEAGKIHKNLVIPTTFLPEFKYKFGREKNTELRSLRDGLNSPVYTRVTQEMVSFEIYQPSLVVIQIRNSVIAKNYLDSFEILWKTSRPKLNR